MYSCESLWRGSCWGNPLVTNTLCQRVLIPFSEPRVKGSNSGFLIAYSWLLLRCALVGGGLSLDDGLMVTSSWWAAARRLFVLSNILASASVIACPIYIVPFFFPEALPLCLPRGDHPPCAKRNFFFCLRIKQRQRPRLSIKSTTLPVFKPVHITYKSHFSHSEFLDSNQLRDGPSI
jgi:hypothetical protein